MRKKRRFLPVLLLAFLFFMSGCRSTIDIFQLEDEGEIDVTFQAITNEMKQPRENETTLHSEELEAIQLSLLSNRPTLAYKIYFDTIDSQFPVDSSPTQKDEAVATLALIQETYEKADYPDFFTPGKHQIKIFQYDAVNDPDRLLLPTNIQAIQTIDYEITE